MKLKGGGARSNIYLEKSLMRELREFSDSTGIPAACHDSSCDPRISGSGEKEGSVVYSMSF
jgi:hypothetical protein